MKTRFSKELMKKIVLLSAICCVILALCITLVVILRSYLAITEDNVSVNQKQPNKNQQIAASNDNTDITTQSYDPSGIDAEITDELDSDSDLGIDDVGQYLNSTEGQQFQAIAETFVVAYIQGDIESMKSLMINPDYPYHDFSTKDNPLDVNSYVLKISADDIRGNFIVAEYEFITKENDSYTYLNLEMEKVEEDWKIKNYGLEK